MSRDLQLNHTSFSLLISCNKNISAQIKKFKDLFLKTMGVRERKIFPTLLPALKQVYSVRLFVCMVSFIITIFPSEAFEVCALIYLVTWQSPLAELAGRDTQGCVLQGACSPRAGPAWGHWDLRGDTGTCLLWSLCMPATWWERIWSPSRSDTWTLGIAHWENRSFIPNLNGCRRWWGVLWTASCYTYVCLPSIPVCSFGRFRQLCKLFLTAVEVRDACDFSKDWQCSEELAFSRTGMRLPCHH